MKKLLLLAVIGALGFNAWQRVSEPAAAPAPAAAPRPDVRDLQVERPTQVSQQYRCDGRTRCTQMTSCEEAMYFLQNCPGVKMDGEGDGIPCEDQWCGSR